MKIPHKWTHALRSEYTYLLDVRHKSQSQGYHRGAWPRPHTPPTQPNLPGKSKGQTLQHHTTNSGASASASAELCDRQTIEPNPNQKPDRQYPMHPM